MHMYEDYSYSDLIELFLDGEASEVQQTTLFAALAHDSDLQLEFQEALDIRLAVEQDLRTIAPSPALHKQVFERAGIAPPLLQDTISSVPQTIKPQVRTILSHLGINLFVATIASLLTIFFLGKTVDSPSTVPSQALEHVQESPLASNNQLTMAAPLAKPHSYSSVALPSSPFTTALPQPNTLPSSTEPALEHRLSQSPPTRVPKTFAIESTMPRVLDPWSLPPIKSVDIVSSAPQMSRIPYQPTRNSLLALPSTPSRLSELDATWSLQLRGIQGLTWSPERTIQQTGLRPLENFSVNLLYHLESQHAIGLEYGRELFPHYFATNEQDFEHNSHLVWFGLTYRYNIGTITALGDLKPFSQTTLAGTSSGPLGKLMLGLEFQPFSYLSTAIGIEGTILGYEFQQKIYSARKLGVYYMLNVHL